MKKKKIFDMFPSFALFTQIGLGMAVPVILAALAGEFIDQKLGTRYVFLILFLLLGIVSGFVILHRQILLIINRKTAETESKNMADEEKHE